MKNIFRVSAVVALLFSLFLVSCKNTSVVKEEEFSGFLFDYSSLEPTKLKSGRVVSRWVHTDFRQKNYSAIIIEPVTFFPEPQVQSQVDSAALSDIKKELDKRIFNLAKNDNIPLSGKPGAGVLKLRSAITSIQINDKEFSARELIPIRLIISGLEMAVDGRDRDVTIIFEYELFDSITKEVMFKGIRKGNAIELSNKEEKLLLGHVSPLLDQWSMDFHAGFIELSRILTGVK